jgi:hypothetical protein
MGAKEIWSTGVPDVVAGQGFQAVGSDRVQASQSRGGRALLCDASSYLEVADASTVYVLLLGVRNVAFVRVSETSIDF